MVQNASEISRELVRQRNKCLALLERLDEKSLIRVSRNARLEQQRKYYTPKANGRGRPAKRPKPPSREDEARRAQYIAEIALLNEAIAKMQEGRSSFLQWLQIERELPSENPQRQRKVERLLGQFGEQKSSTASPATWEPNAVYAYLSALHARQQARVEVFKRLAVITLGEQDDEDRERAKLAVLERFCTSRHAESREGLVKAARVILIDRHIPRHSPHSAAGYRKAWQEAVEELVAELLRRFAPC